MKTIVGLVVTGFGFAISVCFLVVCGIFFLGWTPNVAEGGSVFGWWATLFGLLWISVPLTFCGIGLIGVLYHRCFR